MRHSIFKLGTIGSSGIGGILGVYSEIDTWKHKNNHYTVKDKAFGTISCGIVGVYLGGIVFVSLPVIVPLVVLSELSNSLTKIRDSKPRT